MTDALSSNNEYEDVSVQWQGRREERRYEKRKRLTKEKPEKEKQGKKKSANKSESKKKEKSTETHSMKGNMCVCVCVFECALKDNGEHYRISVNASALSSQHLIPLIEMLEMLCR